MVHHSHDRYDSVQNLTLRFREIYSVAPNDLGWRWLTYWYKLCTSRLKVQPFVYLIPVSFLIAGILYVTLGNLLVGLVSLLQHGF